MFTCENCIQRNLSKADTSIAPQSGGACERCDAVGICFDIPLRRAMAVVENYFSKTKFKTEVSFIMSGLRNLETGRLGNAASNFNTAATLLGPRK